jgi:hypothetical protein
MYEVWRINVQASWEVKGCSEGVASLSIGALIATNV